MGNEYHHTQEPTTRPAPSPVQRGTGHFSQPSWSTSQQGGLAPGIRRGNLPIGEAPIPWPAPISSPFQPSVPNWCWPLLALQYERAFAPALLPLPTYHLKARPCTPAHFCPTPGPQPLRAPPGFPQPESLPFLPQSRLPPLRPPCPHGVEKIQASAFRDLRMVDLSSPHLDTATPAPV